MSVYRNIGMQGIRLCKPENIGRVRGLLQSGFNSSYVLNSSLTSNSNQSCIEQSPNKGDNKSVRKSNYCHVATSRSRTHTTLNKNLYIHNSWGISSLLDSKITSSKRLNWINASLQEFRPKYYGRQLHGMKAKEKFFSQNSRTYHTTASSNRINYPLSGYLLKSSFMWCYSTKYNRQTVRNTTNFNNFLQNSKHHSGLFSSASQHCSLSFWSSSNTTATDLNKAVTEAEKIVGYSTSFLSLRCLLSDELSNVAMQMRKLIGTNHPLLKTARKLFYNGKQGLQTRGLLVLLISKAGGPSPHQNLNNEYMVSGIYPRQRTLAEITEMIHTASLIHKGVINLSALYGQPPAASTAISATEANAVTNATATAVANATAVVLNGSSTSPTAYRADMEFGNKMAVLSGDFLLANASTGLASLRNTKVVEMMSEAIGDLMKAEFTALRDPDGSHILSPGGASVMDWEEQSFLSSGSLISHSCASTLLLANHSEALCDAAFNFGKQISLANQINEELQPLLYGETEESKGVKRGNGGGLTLSSLPLLLYVQRYNEEQFAKSLLSGEQPSQGKIQRELARHRSELVSEARAMRASYASAAQNSLSAFNPSSAHKALENIVSAITHV